MAFTDVPDGLANIRQAQFARPALRVDVHVPDAASIADGLDPTNRHRYIPTPELFRENAACLLVELGGFLDHGDLLSVGIHDADEMMWVGQGRGTKDAHVPIGSV